MFKGCDPAQQGLEEVRQGHFSPLDSLFLETSSPAELTTQLLEKPLK